MDVKVFKIDYLDVCEYIRTLMASTLLAPVKPLVGFARGLIQD